MTIDTATNTFMQSIQVPTLTAFSHLIAIIFDPIVLILATILIAIYLNIKKRKKESIFLIITIIATALIIKLLKEIIRRPRPLIANSYQLITSFSFPSGHTTMTLVFLGLIAFIFANKKYKTTTTLITTAIVILIAFTRIYLRVHWLTDIIASIILGILILVISITVYKKY